MTVESWAQREYRADHALREEKIDAIRLPAIAFLCNQDAFVQATEKLSLPARITIVLSAIYEAAVLITKRTPDEINTVLIWRNLIASTRVDPVHLRYEKWLRAAGVRPQEAPNHIPTIIAAGKLLADEYDLGHLTSENP